MPLSVRDKMTLDWKRLTWKYTGAKAPRIRELFDESETRYAQRLNVLLDDPEAVAYDGQLVKRLGRLRDARREQRAGSSQVR